MIACQYLEPQQKKPVEKPSTVASMPVATRDTIMKDPTGHMKRGHKEVSVDAVCDKDEFDKKPAAKPMIGSAANAEVPMRADKIMDDPTGHMKRGHDEISATVPGKEACKGPGSKASVIPDLITFNFPKNAHLLEVLIRIIVGLVGRDHDSTNRNVVQYSSVLVAYGAAYAFY